jgi:uncharacterized protein YbaR (Trm112 family)
VLACPVCSPPLNQIRATRTISSFDNVIIRCWLLLSMSDVTLTDGCGVLPSTTGMIYDRHVNRLSAVLYIAGIVGRWMFLIRDR